MGSQPRAPGLGPRPPPVARERTPGPRETGLQEELGLCAHAALQGYRECGSAGRIQGPAGRISLFRQQFLCCQLCRFAWEKLQAPCGWPVALVTSGAVCAESTTTTRACVGA